MYDRLRHGGLISKKDCNSMSDLGGLMSRSDNNQCIYNTITANNKHLYYIILHCTHAFMF